MGVLNCAVHDCETIGCSTLLFGSYICWKCQDRFRKYAAKETGGETTEPQLKQLWEAFKALPMDAGLDKEPVGDLLDRLFDSPEW